MKNIFNFIKPREIADPIIVFSKFKLEKGIDNNYDLVIGYKFARTYDVTNVKSIRLKYKQCNITYEILFNINSNKNPLTIRHFSEDNCKIIPCEIEIIDNFKNVHNIKINKSNYKIYFNN